VWTVGEVFCGAGGSALGFQRAGFQIVWGIDNDESACKTFEHNIGGTCRNGKVEDTDFSSLPAVSGLSFGLPCNDFSSLGKRRGLNGYYGSLYKHAVRAVSEISPLWFVAENVPGFMAKNKGSAVLQELADAGRGYIVTVHLYKFEQYGVPQTRWRIIACGIRSDLGMLFRPPAPTHTTPVTCEEALRGVEEVPHNNEMPRHKTRTVELLRAIPEGSNAWDPAVPEHLRLNAAGCRMKLIYRRLKRDMPAYTVVASGGGGTYVYHFEEPRALTNRERARLQTFPDSFIFFGPPTAVRRQIGMAVPPLGAEAVARALRSCLLGHYYASVEPSEGVVFPRGASGSVPHEPGSRTAAETRDAAAESRGVAL